MSGAVTLEDLQTHAPALHVPSVPPGASARAHALALADAGWYVGPVQAGTKNPGSVLGGSWPQKSSRDHAQIEEWFPPGTKRGIFLHVGRSGALAFDVDNPAAVPPVLAAELGAAPFHSTRADVPGKGHYLFAARAGEFGNGTGGLGPDWGEVRGRNGVIIVAPSVHPDGGRYAWERTGPVPALPASLATQLPSRTRSAAGIREGYSASIPEIEEFAQAHNASLRPEKLRSVVNSYAERVARGASRHDSMSIVACWAMREARQGDYSVTEAAEALGNAFITAATRDIPGKRERTVEQANEEFVGILAWAIAESYVEDEAAEVQAEVEESSWAPYDATDILNGTYVPETPVYLRRDDGVSLLYVGHVHSLHGESESGKSWVALLAVQEALAAGERALVIDFESDPQTVYSRLMLMGTPTSALRERFAYVRPEVAPTAGVRTKEDFAALLRGGWAVVIIDGVTDALAVLGQPGREEDGIAKFFAELPRKFSRAGAAVAMVDHVSKSIEGRGRFAIGSQHKMSALDGAGYLVEVKEPFGRGMRGTAVLRVTKDRPGSVRPHGGEFRASDRTQVVAEFVLDSREDRVTASLTAPSAPGDGAGDAGGGGQVQRAAALRVERMQRVVQYVTDAPGQSGNVICKHVTGSTQDILEDLRQAADEGLLMIQNDGKAKRYYPSGKGPLTC